MCAKCDDGVLLFSTAPTLVATVTREQITSTEEKQNPKLHTTQQIHIKFRLLQNIVE